MPSKILGLTDTGSLETTPAESIAGSINIPTLMVGKLDVNTSLGLPTADSPQNPRDLVLSNTRLKFHDGQNIRTVANLDDVSTSGSGFYTRRDYNVYVALGARANTDLVNTTFSGQRLYLMPIIFGRSFETQSIAFYTTTNASRTVSIGVYMSYYDSVSRREAPSACVTSIIVNTSGRGEYATSFSFLFDVGILYWLAFLCVGGSISCTALPLDAQQYLIGSIALTGTENSTHLYTYATTLPSSLVNTVLTYGTGNVPAIFARENL